MESLAFMVAGLVLLFSVSGPLAVILAYNDCWLAALACGALACSTGLHWFWNVTTGVRYLGLICALLGLAAAGVILSRVLAL